MTQQVENKKHIIKYTSNATVCIDSRMPVVNVYLGAFSFCMRNIICAIGSTTICTYGASSCHTTWISKNTTNTKLNRETFIHSNNQISICLHAAMLNMLNYQSQVTAVSYSLMKTYIKYECKTYKM